MYVVLTQNSEVYAQAWSAAIWSLSRPESARDPADVSSMYCGWLVHSDGRVALNLPDGDTVYVHPDADVSTFVDSLPVTQGEKDAVSAAIEGAKGGHIAPVEILPQTLLDNAMTQQEAEADGWFS